MLKYIVYINNKYHVFSDIFRICCSCPFQITLTYRNVYSVLTPGRICFVACNASILVSPGSSIKLVSLKDYPAAINV